MPSSWALIPSGVSAGQQFRLIFVTSTTRSGESTAIADYDSHVQTAAAQGHTAIQSYSTHFKALASTSSTDARDHTSTNPSDGNTGVPIYWLNGSKVADDNSDFYNGWDSNAPTNESGSTTATNIEVFTGTRNDGTKHNGHLGTTGSDVRIGGPGRSGKELNNGKKPKTESHSFYGLSGVFTVASGVPTLSMATVDGATLALTYSAALDETSEPAASDFSVSVASSVRTVSAVDVSGTTVTLTLESAVQYGETVTLSYTPGTNPIKNASGSAAALADESVTNGTLPVLTVAQASASEGDALAFVVTLSSAITDAVTVAYETADGTATQGTDFTQAQGTLTFSAGDTEKTVSVSTLEDQADEGSETFPLLLSSPSNAAFPGGGAELRTDGTILDDDPPTVVEVASSWGLVPDGLSGGDQFRLLFVSSTTRKGGQGLIGPYDSHVRRAAGAGHDDIVTHSGHFRVLGSVAGVGARQHTATSFTSQAPGVPIYWLGGAKVADNYSDFYDGTWDSNAPRNESGVTASTSVKVFTGSASDGTKVANSVLGAAGGKARIGEPGTSGKELSSGTDEDSASRLAFYGLSGLFQVAAPTALPTPTAEVKGSTLTLKFGATLDTTSTPAPGDFAVTVASVTVNVTGVSVSTSAVELTLASAVTVGQTVTVSYTPGTNPIQDTAAIAAGSFTNLAVTNLAVRELSIADSAGDEGDSLDFTVTLAPASSETVTVAYETADGTATAGMDFTSGSGTLTFSAGETSKTITVATVEDRTFEETETFTLTLSEASNASLAGGGSTLDATGTIRDDDVKLDAAGASVDGAALTLRYGSALDIRSVPPTTAFSLSVDGNTPTVLGVRVDSSDVTLTLQPAVEHGQQVSLSYAPGATRVRNADGTEAIPLSSRTVTNNTPADPEAGTDRAVLVKFFNATSGVKWASNANWRTQMPLEEWHGVRTDGNGRVTALDLNGNQLAGVVPVDISELGRLERLSIANNEVCVPGAASISSWLADIDFDGAYCASGESVIDIAFFYTPGAARLRGGHRFMRAYVEALTAQANAIFSASGVGIRLSVVLVEQTGYIEAGDRMSTHRNRLADPDDTYMDEVHVKRDLAGADLVHLVAVGPDNVARGVANQLVKVSPKSSHLAFSVTTPNSGGALFAHELGHVLGIQHDRTETCTGTACGQAAYPYGYGYVNQRAFDAGAANRSRWRTIMSYNDQCRQAGFSCDRISRFSDPTSNFRGDPLGVAGGEWTIALDGPSDAVRSLNNSRETVARYRSSVARYMGDQGERFVDSSWLLVPSELGVGDPFRLLFVSSGTRNGRRDAIERYDTHVQQAAASGHPAIRSYSSHFRALASTPTVDARDHTATAGTVSDRGVPIYWLDGAKVADDYIDFYDGTWDSNAPRNELGMPGSADDAPFTGSNSDGTKTSAEHLGTTSSEQVRIGSPAVSGKEIDSGTTGEKGSRGQFYGLSGVFKIVRDEDEPKRVTLAVAPTTVSEGSGATEITVTAILEESEVSDTHLELQVREGTAAWPEDFQADRRVISVTVPAGEHRATGTFTLTPARDGGEPECPETVIVRASRGLQTRSALDVAPVYLTISDPDSDELRCMAPAERAATTVRPDGSPNPARGPDAGADDGPASTDVPPPSGTPAKVAIWTDQSGYTRGQPVRLYRSIDHMGDKNEYTFFYSLENVDTGLRYYFAPETGSTTLENEVVDHFGFASGAFRARTIRNADKELIWAGAIPRVGLWRFALEVRSADASTEVKAAQASLTVSRNAPVVVGSDGSATVFVSNQTWTSDTIYKLRGPVRVQTGATLTIEAGTLIQGRGPAASVIVEPGARIEAIGNPAAPVVMTCEAPIGERYPGCWEGLTVLGDAPTSRSESTAADGSEGVAREYGGDNSGGSSGTLKYVRVEFAGGASTSETQTGALAFYGVGSGTVIDHVQSHASSGDGIEFRGGAAHCRYCVSSSAQDDALEWSEGWTGTAQHLFLQQGEVAGSGIEASGPPADSPGPLLPAPSLYNVTATGAAAPSGRLSGSHGIRLGEGSTVTARNVILTGFGGFAVGAESVAASLFVDGRSSIRNAILHKNGERYGVAQTEESISPYVEFLDEDPRLRNARHEANPDPRPTKESVALRANSVAVPPHDEDIWDEAPYVGAFGAWNWLEGWTFFGPEEDYRVPDPSGQER